MRVQRPSGPLLASIIVHVAVVALFVQALVMQRPLLDMFRRARPPVQERVLYVTMPTGTGPAAPGRPPARGVPRPVAPPPVLRAPVDVPSTIPIPPKAPRYNAPVEGPPIVGPLGGGNGVMSGIQPHYGDGRLWSPPGSSNVAVVPQTKAEEIQGLIRQGIAAYNDSLRIAQGQRAPGDWTVEKNGQKYGIDQKFIRLGPVSIPTAILALLPLNITANPTVTQRERNLNYMQRDIELHARQQITEADFQKSVRALRQRKERERKEREAAKAQSDQQQKAAESSSAAPSESTP